MLLIGRVVVAKQVASSMNDYQDDIPYSFLILPEER